MYHAIICLWIVHNIYSVFCIRSSSKFNNQKYDTRFVHHPNHTFCWPVKSQRLLHEPRTIVID